MSIDAMIEATIGKEGGYSNHPADRGGPTRWGVTEAVARKHGYQGDMRNLPRQTAYRIYEREYAIAPGFAAVAEISPAVGEELFDTGVNMGPSVPAIWFQRGLNVLNRNGADYADVVADGQIGPKTLEAFRAFRRVRGPKDADLVMRRILEGFQAVRYVELCERRTPNEAFGFGWLRTRVSMA